MKKTLLFIVGLLLMGELLARHSKAIFYTTHGEAFILYVNGKPMNQRPVTRIYLDHLSPGRNNVAVKVIKSGQHNFKFHCPVYINEGYQSDFAINPDGFGYSVKKVSAKPLAHRPHHHGSYNKHRYTGRNSLDNHHRKKHAYLSDYNRSHYVNIDAILYSLNDYYFDRDKLAFAKRAMNGKHIYSRDVARIMRTFTFDHYKLDFAVFAYRHTIDKENFYTVKSSFDFRSTARELDDHIYY